MKIIDLRSDTVTKPSFAMRQAIANAEVGDDVYGEDPTVNSLQEQIAGIFGKEAGLFVPTGSMSNQLAIKAHTNPGDEVILEADSHIFQYETAAPAMMSNVQLYPVKGERGVMDADDIRDVIRPGAYYFPHTTLVCLENTHNKAGGTILPIERIREIRRLTLERGIALHLDGARIWNAHVAAGTPFHEYGDSVDSISVCFSKGLGAPIGSMLLGSEEIVEKAHRYRKIFGGGMRQVGVLAAAAKFAFENNLPLLASDHEHAKLFASALSGMKSFQIDPEAVQTNMARLDFSRSSMTAEDAQKILREQGILIGQSASTILRAVFHLDLAREDVEEAIGIIKNAFD